MKRLKKKKASSNTFFHGSPLPRALEILKSGQISSINSQGENARSIQNVSLQNNMVYISNDFLVSKPYALNFGRAEYGIVFEFNVDMNQINIDEDSFYNGESFVDGENRETFLRMFNNDKQAVHDFIQELIDQGFFENKTGYDQFDEEEFELNFDDFVAKDKDGYWCLNIADLMYSNQEMSNSILDKIPFEDQMKTGSATFAYKGDIPLSSVINFTLVSSSSDVSYSNSEDLIAEYEKNLSIK